VVELLQVTYARARAVIASRRDVIETLAEELLTNTCAQLPARRCHLCDCASQAVTGDDNHLGVRKLKISARPLAHNRRKAGGGGGGGGAPPHRALGGV